MSETAAKISPDTPVTPDMLEGTTVNASTYLSTDYLNHFNEAIMILELAQSMPDCLDDVLDWKPKTYVQHFEQSGLHVRELAIAAFLQAPPSVRKRFDAMIDEMNEIMVSGLNWIISARESGEMEAALHMAGETASTIRRQAETASALINGDGADEHLAEPDLQAEVDALFA